MSAPTRLSALLASYAGYHRDARNRRTHYVGVPLISYAVLAALALLGWRLFGTRVPLDRVAVAALAVFYLALDVRLGLLLTGMLAALAAAGEWTVLLGPHVTLGAAAAAFVVGWALQLLGHHLEGNRPALLDNLLQILIAPIYLTAELAFALGWRRQLQASLRHIGAAR